MGLLTLAPAKKTKIAQNTRSKTTKSVVSEGFKSLLSAAKAIARKKRMNANDRLLLDGFREVYRPDIRRGAGTTSALSVPLEDAIRVTAEVSQRSVPLDYEDLMDVDEYSDDENSDDMDVDEENYIPANEPRRL